MNEGANSTAKDDDAASRHSKENVDRNGGGDSNHGSIGKLKQSLSSYKGSLTRKINHIKRLAVDPNNTDAIAAAKEDLKMTLKLYIDTRNAYLELIDSDTDRAALNANCEVVFASVHAALGLPNLCHDETVPDPSNSHHGAVSGPSNLHQEEDMHATEVGPDDSVSNVSTQRNATSYTSSVMSLASAQIQEAINQADLEVELAHLEVNQQLRMKGERAAIQKRIDKAKARQDVLSALSSRQPSIVSRSDRSSKHIQLRKFVNKPRHTHSLASHISSANLSKSSSCSRPESAPVVSTTVRSTILNVRSAPFHLPPRHISTTPSNINRPNLSTMPVATTFTTVPCYSEATQHRTTMATNPIELPTLQGHRQNIMPNPLHNPPRPDTATLHGDTSSTQPTSTDSTQPTATVSSDKNEYTAMLRQQQQYVAAMTLPNIQMTTFDGKALDYISFIKAFDILVESKEPDHQRRLYYLEYFTSGRPNDIVRSCQFLDPAIGYTTARQLLHNKYGDRYSIAMETVDNLMQSPNVKSEDPDALERFSILLLTCSTSLQSMGFLNMLNNADILRAIVMKLPHKLQESWRHRADYITYEANEMINIGHISQFVERRSRECNHPIFGRLPTKQNSSRYSAANRYGATFATSTENDEQNQPTACIFCSEPHKLYKCPGFKELTQTDRFTFAKEHDLCLRCLSKGHFIRDCRSNGLCNIHGCNREHHTLLHRTPRSFQLPTATSGYVNQLSSNKTVMAVVPVKVRMSGSTSAVTTLAFLDNGSDSTFCSDSLARKLQAPYTTARLLLTTLGDQPANASCSIVSNIEISNLYEENFIVLPSVYTRPCIPIRKQDLVTNEDLASWPHLSEIDLPQHNCTEVELLIGCNVPEAIEPLEVKRSETGGPYATKTRLGWTINGPIGSRNGSARAFFAKTQMCELCTDVIENRDDSKKAWSVEDHQFMTLANKSLIHLPSQHYQLNLPFKVNPPPQMPDNHFQAKKRLLNLRRRFRDNDLFCQYDGQIAELIKNGYASKVPEDEVSPNVWYIPHHAVVHQYKKLRVVFDCSARYHGVCLNDVLLQGPELTNSLVGVLLRFRSEKVAMSSDVTSMFHQVFVAPEDRPYLRFLWWPNRDMAAEPETYQMNVFLFGTITSPSCVNFVLRKTAEDNQEDFNEVAIKTVNNNFYVDDCLVSVPDKDMAIALAKDLRNLLAKGGFDLKKWVSNDRDVLAAIPNGDLRTSFQNLNFKSDNLPSDRALGIEWSIKDDTLQFNRKITDGAVVSRRTILSNTASLFDPLGFISPCIVPAKILFQDLCREKFKWDDPLPNNYLHRWEKFVRNLESLKNFTIPRCIKPPDFKDVNTIELHHFSDASQRVYGCVSYLRLVDETGRTHVAYLFSKSRLAPLKPMTIPRLELAAATLAVKNHIMLKEELQLQIQRQYFWTDSETVLRYILNTTSQFHTFVSNRIGFIRSNTEINDWKHVKTTENPADIVSRGIDPSSLVTSKMWMNGPEFLHQDSKFWVPQPLFTRALQSDDPEVKKVANVHLTHSSMAAKCTWISDLLEKCSSWNKILNVTSWVLRAVNRMKKIPILVDMITPEERNKSEMLLLQHVQLDSFKGEIKCLQTNQCIKKSSTLVKLDPIIGEDGLLRVGGRLSSARFDLNTTHPIIVPKRSRLAALLINDVHQRNGHAGRQHVLSILRQRFWIINGNSSVRSVLKNCLKCRRLFGTAASQKMANLPIERITPDLPPFTHIGVDCFGPFTVRRGRSDIKRYGVLFTCLNVRAIHIEVAETLEANSFILALRRFLARRGPVTSITSDNGTNFVGADRELRQAVSNWNRHQILHEFQQNNITWKFNPPYGSHFGGVWERCIRTVRRVLKSLSNEQRMTDESLLTLMIEAESIVNSRPLYAVSGDAKDLIPISPNSLLNLKDQSSMPPDVFDPKDLYSKRRWRQIQYLADVFGDDGSGNISHYYN